MDSFFLEKIIYTNEHPNTEFIIENQLTKNATFFKNDFLENDDDCVPILR